MNDLQAELLSRLPSEHDGDALDEIVRLAILKTPQIRHLKSFVAGMDRLEDLRSTIGERNRLQKLIEIIYSQLNESCGPNGHKVTLVIDLRDWLKREMPSLPDPINYTLGEDGTMQPSEAITQ